MDLFWGFVNNVIGFNCVMSEERDTRKSFSGGTIRKSGHTIYICLAKTHFKKIIL